MASGNLDRRIIFESATLVQNAFGEKTKIWATAYTCWGERVYEGGDESSENSQVVALNIV